MSAPKHTEGPWVVERGTHTLWVGPSKVGRVKVGDIVVALDFGPDYRPEFYERQDANARLIASAPDLLEAARLAERELVLVEDGSTGGVPNAVAALIPEAIAALRAAIARATGQ